MNEIEHLLERAQITRTMARKMTLSREADRLFERAAEFERQAARLKARLALLSDG